MSALTCPRCEEKLPRRANFCPNCGAPVSVPESSERRVVTVIFVDLAGSTQLAAQLDPERVREVLTAFHEMVTEQVSWLGGQVERYVGDAVLGVFGTPVAHDDDAARAIRAALAVRDGAARLGTALGLSAPLEVRIGVSTGRVAVGTVSDRPIVIGAEVNKGARIQQAALPGEILVGSTAYQLAQASVDFGPMRWVDAKGFDEELSAWPVLGLRESPSGPMRVPLVNRRRELTLLTDTFERVQARERAHLVTLLGEPGIGKSRVLEEFLASLPEDARVLQGRSSPFEEDVTFWPLAQMVYGEIGEPRGAPEERVLERLRDVVAGWAPPEAVDGEVRRLALALGLGEQANEENRYHATEVRHGFFSMLTGHASRGPVVLVFEDLHAADPLLLELIEQLVKEARRVPLMVVCAARWELLETRPDWAGGLADAVTLWVEPLGGGHAAQLARVAGGLEPEEAERVARHTGGNPFFIVEIASMLAREQRALPTGPGPLHRVLPDTVQAVVAARLDQLSQGARELVRRASVFPRGRLELTELALVAEPRKELLAELEDEELLVPDDDRPGGRRFRSDVVRDVAYESLAKRERQRLHLRVANKLADSDDAELYPRTIAFHLEQAARASLDLSPRDRTLADRAVDALVIAGDQARRRMESRAAADLYGRALDLIGPEEREGAREAWAVSMLGEARYWLGEFDAAETDFRRAMAMAEEGNDRVLAHASRFLADITLTVRGDDHLAGALFERSLEAARAVGDPYVLARTLLMAAWAPLWRGRLEESEARFREALGTARSNPSRDPWVESRALAGLAQVTSLQGSEEDALTTGREALAVAEGANQAFTAAEAHQVIAVSLRRLLRLDEALEHADAAVQALRDMGARWELAGALGDRGSIHRMAGDAGGAERDLREALVLCRDLHERALVTWIVAELARTLAIQGATAEARSVLEDAFARRADGEPGSMSALYLAEATVSWMEGDGLTSALKAQAAIVADTEPTLVPNLRAASIWWTGTLFGAEAVGGPGALEQAREWLERNGWRQALREPELVLPAS